MPDGFTLSLEFVGMCMFVPDLPHGSVYVLSPAAGAGCDHSMPEHVARLCFDTAYLRPDAAGTDGVTAVFPLKNVSLRVEGSDGLYFQSEPAVANLAAVVNQGVPAKVLQGDPEGTLNARVTLKSGHNEPATLCARWLFPDTVRKLTNQVLWTTAYPGTELDLTMTGFDGSIPDTPLPTLYPIGGETREIKLSLYCTPREELPPHPLDSMPPPPCTPAHHFAAFYRVFSPLLVGPLPVFVGGDMSGGSPYTCMVAQANPGG